MTFQTPDTFYFIAVNFTRNGFGSGGDLMSNWDAIVDQYADDLINDCPRRVFRVEMDADNMPASIADVTADADETISERRAAYLATAPVWEIDPEHDNPDKYDERCDMRREAV